MGDTFHAETNAQLNAANAQLNAKLDHVARAVDELVKNQRQQQAQGSSVRQVSSCFRE